MTPAVPNPACSDNALSVAHLAPDGSSEVRLRNLEVVHVVFQGTFACGNFFHHDLELRADRRQRISNLLLPGIDLIIFLSKATLCGW